MDYEILNRREDVAKQQQQNKADDLMHREIEDTERSIKENEDKAITFETTFSRASSAKMEIFCAAKRNRAKQEKRSSRLSPTDMGQVS